MVNKAFFKQKKNKRTFLPRPLLESEVVGTFNGHCVVIEDVEHMEKLYAAGCYGKGIFSRSVARFKPVDDLICETTNLILEEAFFLSYAIGCLQVKWKEQFLNLDEMWNLFKSDSNNFVARYAAYQYFRMAGWTVRTGIKFGSDFMLYKQGPEFYHASYSVLVRSCINPSPSDGTQSWVQLASVNRTTESAAKELLLCDIIPTQSLTDFTTPQCIQHLKLNVIVFKRWVSTQERILCI